MTDRISVAVRVAGLVVAAGYLLAVTEGPLMMVVGALALITFGRGLVVDRTHEALAGASLAVIAAALGVVALRWGSFDLGDIRGAQGVLGPSIAVGPQETVVAMGMAAGAGLVALIVWLGEAPDPQVDRLWLRRSEAACGALAVVTVFWGPAVRGANLLDLLSWVGAVAAVAAVGLGGSLLIARARASLAWAACCVAAAAAVAAAMLVALR